MDSRQAWTSAVSYEEQSTTDPDRKTSLQQAFSRYELSVEDLERAKESQGFLLIPATYVPLAKSHLDAARTLYLLDQEPAANAEVWVAESLLRDILLNQDPANPLPRAWLWRIYYLLGDANLYQKNVAIALFDYQKAQLLKPGFVPASAMAQYLGEAVQPVQISWVHKTQSAASPQSRTAASEEPTPPPTPENRTAREVLLQHMEAVSSSKSFSQAAAFVTTSATLLEVTELAPVAAALTLSGMIVDYVAK